MTSQAPGWYDDPENPAQQRYWDGNAWTDQRRPQQGPPPFQGQFGQNDLPRYGQPAQHGQVYGQRTEPAPQYGQRVTQQGAYQAYPAYPQTGPGYAMQPPGVATTPDGVPLAGWWRRVLARFLDSVIAWFIALPLTGYFYYRTSAEMTAWFEDVIEAARAGSATPPTMPAEVLQWALPASVIGYLVLFVYEYLFLVKKGRTPGKMAVGIAVRLRDRPGNPPPAAAAKRCGLDLGLALAGAIPVIGFVASFAALANYLWPLWDDKKQALHDKVAGTNVVRTGP